MVLFPFNVELTNGAHLQCFFKHLFKKVLLYHMKLCFSVFVVHIELFGSNLERNCSFVGIAHPKVEKLEKL